MQSDTRNLVTCTILVFQQHINESNLHTTDKIMSLSERLLTCCASPDEPDNISVTAPVSINCCNHVGSSNSGADRNAGKGIFQSRARRKFFKRQGSKDKSTDEKTESETGKSCSVAHTKTDSKLAFNETSIHDAPSSA